MSCCLQLALVVKYQQYPTTNHVHDPSRHAYAYIACLGGQPRARLDTHRITTTTFSVVRTVVKFGSTVDNFLLLSSVLRARVVRLMIFYLLMLEPSFKVLPVAPVFFDRSEPARSTRLSLELRLVSRVTPSLSSSVVFFST